MQERKASIELRVMRSLILSFRIVIYYTRT